MRGPEYCKDQTHASIWNAGKPARNAFIESFNGKLRDECLNETLFSSLAEARETPETWQEDDNTRRPQPALGNLTPRVFAEKINMGKLAA